MNWAKAQMQVVLWFSGINAGAIYLSAERKYIDKYLSHNSLQLCIFYSKYYFTF